MKKARKTKRYTEKGGREKRSQFGWRSWGEAAQVATLGTKRTMMN